MISQRGCSVKIVVALSAMVLLWGCESVVLPLSVTEPGDAYEKLTEEDILQAATALQHSLESNIDGKPGLWSNKNTGRAGAITPVKTFVTEDGVFCREYLETLVIDGSAKNFENTGCRDEAGIWRWVR